MSVPIDLDHWTPAGKSTADYAVELLCSTHPAEVTSAESWLLAHPDVATPALIDGLTTPSAQSAAVLLGAVGGDEVVDDLRAAHRRGGQGMREAVERGLRLNGSPAAAATLAELTEPEG